VKSAIVEIVVNESFEDAINSLKKNIVAKGFLVLHEINTTEILLKHGIIIDELRQLLFFHPDYMVDVLKIDMLLVNEIPLKFVVRSINQNETSISFTNPLKSMSDYQNAEDLAIRLLEKVYLILDF